MLYEFSDGITEYIEEKGFQIDVIPAEDRLPEYPHITVSVKSLSEYMRMIAFLYEFDNSLHERLAFRGVSDYRYSLSPSLKVYQEREDYGYAYDFYNIENVLVNEFSTTRPEEFVGITSNFDLLAKMQHLGLPTRLLDFSLNPLVALYFACQSQSDTTARVLCARDTSSVNSKDVIEAVCGLYRIQEFAQFYLEDLLKDDAGIIHYMSANIDPLMAHPKCISERIRRQSGIFMVFPNTVSDSAWFNLESREEDCYHINYASLQGKETLRRIKECENPYEIYGIEVEKELMGHRFVVTPDTFHKMKEYYQTPDGFLVDRGNQVHINSSVVWAFRKRFSIDSDVASISPNIMRNNFCSILIDAKYKKSIMRELDQVNINEAFLFPEPEYTAKRIKNRYIK